MSFPILWWPVASAFCKHCATAIEAAARAVSSWLRHQLLYLVPLPPVTESLHLLVYMASELSVSNIVNSNRKRCAGVKLRKVCGAAQPAMRPTQGYFDTSLLASATLLSWYPLATTSTFQSSQESHFWLCIHIILLQSPEYLCGLCAFTAPPYLSSIVRSHNGGRWPLHFASTAQQPSKRLPVQYHPGKHKLCDSKKIQEKNLPQISRTHKSRFNVKNWRWMLSPRVSRPHPVSQKCLVVVRFSRSKNWF